VFEEHRRRLFGLAYRMLGSAAEAEDILQDTYLRWGQAESVAAPASWLTKVVSNLCLNHLTSARVRRESYPGPWLPEPVLTEGGALGPLEAVEQRESVSMGVLVLLERLSPGERAVFVLREAFGYSHQEIAEILEVEQAHSRQLLRRARSRVGEERGRFQVDDAGHRRLVDAFVDAVRSGDVAALEKLLAADVVAWSDGGGRTAARHPVRGRDKVLRYLSGIASHPEALHVTRKVAEVNGQPALLFRDRHGLAAVLTIDPADDRIAAVRLIVNPDKLSFAATQDAARA
jgi:RNA polymerase sigma-70 factor (TIGR02957 family)